MKNMRKVLNEILDENLTPGEFLRGKRIEAGFSQDDIQKITGISRPNVSALENGRLEMTSHYALLLAAALKIHPQEILFPNGKFIYTKKLKAVAKKAEVLHKKHAMGD